MQLFDFYNYYSSKCIQIFDKINTRYDIRGNKDCIIIDVVTVEKPNARGIDHDGGTSKLGISNYSVHSPTKGWSTRNEEGIDLQAETLVERSLLPAIKFAFHTGFSRCVGGRFICLAYPVSRTRRDHSARAHHCYVILITMSNRRVINFGR